MKVFGGTKHAYNPIQSITWTMNNAKSATGYGIRGC